jgi:hypothetical protein
MTRRFPLAGTVPIPLSIEISVPLLTDQRKIADCPLSIEEGSALNSITVGFAGGAGAGGGAVGAGAGGGCTGGFL